MLDCAFWAVLAYAFGVILGIIIFDITMNKKEQKKYPGRSSNQDALSNIRRNFWSQP